jgi:hypothetical protein
MRRGTAENDKALFVQVVASLAPRQVKAEFEKKLQVVYHISDHPIRNYEWAAKYCGPEEKSN